MIFTSSFSTTADLGTRSPALASDDPRLATSGGCEGGPWTHAWTKPRPGQLLQAMQDAGVQPHETLMIGRDERDSAAAQAAGVCYLPWRALLDVEVERHLLAPDAHRIGGVAPESFVAEAEVGSLCTRGRVSAWRHAPALCTALHGHTCRRIMMYERSIWEYETDTVR